MRRPFDNQTIVITGASDGIGRELALQLAAQGARIAAGARNGAKLDEVVAECRARGAQAIAVETDVTDEAACRRLIETAVEAFGGLDVLVNNAGQSMRAKLAEIADLGIFDRLMRVNYLGAVYCTAHALPHLRRSRGLVMAISSLQGKTGFPGFSGYAASKYALHGFFDSLRIELMGSGIGVSVVCPGPVATAIHEHRPTLGAAAPDRSGGADPQGYMPIEDCVRQIIRAMRRRDRELLMTRTGKLLPWLRLLAPGYVDRRTDALVRAFYRKREAGV